MRIELVFIGDELLRGAVVNTNAAYLGQELAALGWKVARQTCIPDQPESIEECLKSALARSDLIVMTGGLGPTLDDRTRDVLAQLFETELALNEEVFGALQARYGHMELSLRNQATIPRTAKALPNSTGTAPGLILEKEGKVVIALPGIPLEMKALFKESVLPFLKERYREEAQFSSENITLICVSESALDPILRKISERYPAVEFGIYPSFEVLTITLTSRQKQWFAKVKEEIQAAFPFNHFSSPSGKIEEAILQLMIAQKKKLVIAESCTGGRVAARLTSVAGASHYLLGSLVTYSNEFKEKLLGVSAKTLKEKSDVSEAVALEMVQGIFHTTQADVGLAVTGLAGPTGGSDKTPVGTLYIAAAERGKDPLVQHYFFPGSREKIQLLATNYALGLLFRILRKL